MKLQHPLGHTTPVDPTFDLLRASLHAAQAATPTAIASSLLDRSHVQVAALHGLLGELAAEDEKQSWRLGSFYSLTDLPKDKAL